jgi:hypothetical protein
MAQERHPKGHVVILIFAASDRDGVNKQIAATQLKLDLAGSGCSHFLSAKQK